MVRTPTDTLIAAMEEAGEAVCSAWLFSRRLTGIF
jgi:hypothetical protein